MPHHRTRQVVSKSSKNTLGSAIVHVYPTIRRGDNVWIVSNAENMSCMNDRGSGAHHRNVCSRIFRGQRCRWFITYECQPMIDSSATARQNSQRQRERFADQRLLPSGVGPDLPFVAVFGVEDDDR